MNYHESSSEDSQRMCEELERSLSTKIPNLKRSVAQQWCSLNQLGRSKFVYIKHRKRTGGLELWCMGKPSDLQAHTKLAIRERQPSSGGFSERFQARVKVESMNYVEEIADMLLQVSYKVS